jgi:hypothetical protein
MTAHQRRVILFEDLEYHLRKHGTRFCWIAWAEIIRGRFLDPQRARTADPLTIFTSPGRRKLRVGRCTFQRLIVESIPTNGAPILVPEVVAIGLGSAAIDPGNDCAHFSV